MLGQDKESSFIERDLTDEHGLNKLGDYHEFSICKRRTRCGDEYQFAHISS
jgi:hypothetical protein